MFVKNQYNTGIFSCFLLHLPCFSSTCTTSINESEAGTVGGGELSTLGTTTRPSTGRIKGSSSDSSRVNSNSRLGICSLSDADATQTIFLDCLTRNCWSSMVEPVPILQPNNVASHPLGRSRPPSKSIGGCRRTHSSRALTHQSSHLGNCRVVSKLQSIAQLAIPVAEPSLQLLKMELGIGGMASMDGGPSPDHNPCIGTLTRNASRSRTTPRFSSVTLLLLALVVLALPLRLLIAADDLRPLVLPTRRLTFAPWL